MSSVWESKSKRVRFRDFDEDPVDVDGGSLDDGVYVRDDNTPRPANWWAEDEPMHVDEVVLEDTYADYLFGHLSDRIRHASADMKAISVIGAWPGKQMGGFVAAPSVEGLQRVLKLGDLVGAGQSAEVYGAEFGLDGRARRVVVKAQKGTKHGLEHEYRVATVLNGLARTIPHFSRAVVYFSCPFAPSTLEFAPEVRGAAKMTDFIVYERVNGPTFEQAIKKAAKLAHDADTVTVVPIMRRLAHDPDALAVTLDARAASLPNVDEVGIISTVIQVYIAIWIAWKQCGFKHNDLHVGNIVMQTIPEKYRQDEHGYDKHCLFEYTFDGNRILLPLWNNQYPVIVDFGRSVVEGTLRDHDYAYSLPTKLPPVEPSGATGDPVMFTASVRATLAALCPTSDLLPYLTIKEGGRPIEALNKLMAWMSGTARDGQPRFPAELVHSDTCQVFTWGTPRDI